MSKRQRKKPKGSRSPSTQRAGAAGAPQDLLRQFTVKGWAVTAQLLKVRRNADAILDLMGFFDWLGAQNMRAIEGQLPRLACKLDCAYCCYVGGDRPDLLPAEAFRIVLYAQSNVDVLDRVKARLQDEEKPGLSQKPGFSDKAPCLFLHKDRCTIYPVRPMRCRAQNSPDAELCRQNYTGQRATMPLLSEPALLYKSLQMGLRVGLRDVGMQSAPLRLTKAIRLALEMPTIWEQWFEKENVFADALYPEPVDESRLIDEFMRTSRSQVWAERETMQRVVLTCLNAPGTWARYALDDVRP